MVNLTRTELKKLLPKVDNLRLPEDFEETEFSVLRYYTWLDQTDDVLNMVYEFNGKLEVIRWRWIRFGLRPYIFTTCDICKRHRKREEILSVSAQTKTLPKGINYRSRAFHVCSDYLKCNLSMTTESGIQKIFNLIFE